MNPKSIPLVAAALLLALLVAFSHPATTRAENNPKPGTIVTSESMTLAANLDGVATGKRITHFSTDPSGNAIVVSGAVLTPRPEILKSHRQNAGKIVAWAHGTMGLADQCAPSRTDHLDLPGFDDYSATVASYLSQGWTVTATDYAGLGTPGLHPYLVGESEGRSVIDSVRAARKLNPDLSDKWVVSGHSQGGQAAIFASELAGTYGKGLQLRGTISLAPASNLDLITQGVVGTPYQGYLVMAIYGLSAVDATVHPEEILAQPALDRVGALETGCFEQLEAFADLTADELLVGGELSEDFHSQLCAFDQPVQLAEYPGVGHVEVLAASQQDVIDYIGDRFAKEPAPSNCG